MKRPLITALEEKMDHHQANIDRDGMQGHVILMALELGQGLVALGWLGITGAVDVNGSLCEIPEIGGRP